MADEHEVPVNAVAARRFEPWPWFLVALLAAMISTSLSLWGIASANPDAVVGDAWEAGLAFNDDLAAQRAAAASGARLQASSEATLAGARLTVRVVAADGQTPVSSRVEGVSVERIRPAESGFDTTISLQLESGAWSADVALPEPGRWRFRVRAELGDSYLLQVIDFWHAPRADATP